MVGGENFCALFHGFHSITPQPGFYMMQAKRKIKNLKLD